MLQACLCLYPAYCSRRLFSRSVSGQRRALALSWLQPSLGMGRKEALSSRTSGQQSLVSPFCHQGPPGSCSFSGCWPFSPRARLLSLFTAISGFTVFTVTTSVQAVCSLLSSSTGQWKSGGLGPQRADSSPAATGPESHDLGQVTAMHALSFSFLI